MEQVLDNVSTPFEVSQFKFMDNFKRWKQQDDILLTGSISWPENFNLKHISCEIAC